MHRNHQCFIKVASMWHRCLLKEQACFLMTTVMNHQCYQFVLDWGGAWSEMKEKLEKLTHLHLQLVNLKDSKTMPLQEIKFWAKRIYFLSLFELYRRISRGNLQTWKRRDDLTVGPNISIYDLCLTNSWSWGSMPVQKFQTKTRSQLASAPGNRVENEHQGADLRHALSTRTRNYLVWPDNSMFIHF